MKKFLFTGVVVVLTGCAGMSQYIAAKGASDKVAIQAANDNIITGIEDALCDLPYGAILRHTELQAAVQSVCGVKNPVTLIPTTKVVIP